MVSQGLTLVTSRSNTDNLFVDYGRPARESLFSTDFRVCRVVGNRFLNQLPLPDDLVGWWAMTIEQARLGPHEAVAIRFRNLRFYFDMVYYQFGSTHDIWALLEALKVKQLADTDQLQWQRVWCWIGRERADAGLFDGVAAYKHIDSNGWPDDWQRYDRIGIDL